MRHERTKNILKMPSDTWYSMGWHNSQMFSYIDNRYDESAVVSVRSKSRRYCIKINTFVYLGNV